MLPSACVRFGSAGTIVPVRLIGGLVAITIGAVVLLSACTPEQQADIARDELASDLRAVDGVASLELDAGRVLRLEQLDQEAIAEAVGTIADIVIEAEAEHPGLFARPSIEVFTAGTLPGPSSIRFLGSSIHEVDAVAAATAWQQIERADDIEAMRFLVLDEPAAGFGVDVTPRGGYTEEKAAQLEAAYEAAWSETDLAEESFIVRVGEH
jgi:hypothetical protein